MENLLALDSELFYKLQQFSVTFPAGWCIIGNRKFYIAIEQVSSQKGFKAGSFEDLIGKLVKFQRGPATVNGSSLQYPLYMNVWEGAENAMTMSQETCLILKHPLTYEDREVFGPAIYSAFLVNDHANISLPFEGMFFYFYRW